MSAFVYTAAEWLARSEADLWCSLATLAKRRNRKAGELLRLGQGADSEASPRSTPSLWRGYVLSKSRQEHLDHLHYVFLTQLRCLTECVPQVLLTKNCLWQKGSLLTDLQTTQPQTVCNGESNTHLDVCAHSCGWPWDEDWELIPSNSGIFGLDWLQPRLGTIAYHTMTMDTVLCVPCTFQLCDTGLNRICWSIVLGRMANLSCGFVTYHWDALSLGVEWRLALDKTSPDRDPAMLRRIFLQSFRGHMSTCGFMCLCVFCLGLAVGPYLDLSLAVFTPMAFALSNFEPFR